MKKQEDDIMNWEDIKRIIKDEGYTDEQIQKKKRKIKNQYGDFLEDKNLLWRKVALELGVTIADDQLSSSQEIKKVTVEELKDGDPETDDVGYELEGFFYDVNKDATTSTGKPKTFFRFCGEDGVITGGVYGDQDIADEIEECRWCKISNAGRYDPANQMLLTLGQYSEIDYFDEELREVIEDSAIPRFDGTDDIPFNASGDDKWKRLRYVQGLVTDDNLRPYMGCTKEGEMGICRTGFDDDGMCKNSNCDGTLEKDGAQMYYYTMKIYVTGVGGFEFQIGPDKATGDEDYEDDFIEGISDAYMKSDGEEVLKIIGLRVLDDEEKERAKQKERQRQIERKKREADEEQWSDVMRDVYDTLSDGRTREMQELANQTGYSRGEVVTAATKLENKVGVIEYPKAGMVTRRDKEAPDGEEEEGSVVEFEDKSLEDVYGLLEDGRIWTAEAASSRLDLSKSEVGNAVTKIQQKVDTIDFPGINKFQRTDVSNSDEVVQPVEHEDDEEEESDEEVEEDEPEEDDEETEEEEPEEDDEDNETFPCPHDDCDKEYQTEGWLNRHLNQAHGEGDDEDGEGGDGESQSEQASLGDVTPEDDDGDGGDEEEESEQKSESGEELETEEESEEDETQTDDDSETKVLDVETVRENVSDDTDDEIGEAITESYKWIKQFGEAPEAGIDKKLKNEFDMSSDDIEKVKMGLQEIPCLTKDDLMFEIVGEE